MLYGRRTRPAANEAVELQCQFLWDLMTDWRVHDRAKLDQIPDADWNRLMRILTRAAMTNRAIPGSSRQWLDIFERKVCRVRDGKSYESPPDPARQTELAFNEPS